MTRDDAWIWLSNINGVWHGTIEKLIDFFGTPEEVYNAGEKELYASKILKEETIKKIIQSKKKTDIEKIWEYLNKSGIQFISVDNNNYPERLKTIYQNPFWLYVKGKLPESRKAAGIVGARACTDYGRQLAERIGYEYARGGIDVVSGMARGIDTYGHLGAIKGNGCTYAVLGCGIDICYPYENIELYNEITVRGGIISEYPPGTKPEGWRFPQRNRIISGLSDNITVIEAKAKSGSLITAELALEQGKDVMAVPGRVTDILSEGCNRLIRDGAEIITDINDLVSSVKNSNEAANVKKNENLNILLEKDFEVVYSETDLLPISMEELVRRTGMDTQKIYEILLKLELENLVYEPVKNYYARRL